MFDVCGVCAYVLFVPPGELLVLPEVCVCVCLLCCQVGTNYYQTYDFIRDFTQRPMSTTEVRTGLEKEGMSGRFLNQQQL